MPAEDEDTDLCTRGGGERDLDDDHDGSMTGLPSCCGSQDSRLPGDRNILNDVVPVDTKLVTDGVDVKRLPEDAFLKAGSFEEDESAVAEAVPGTLGILCGSWGGARHKNGLDQEGAHAL